MIYLKVLDADGNLSSVEAIENPAYVKYQSKNKLLIRCSEFHAQGILSANDAVAYMLDGKDPIPGLTRTAYIIGVAEYEQLRSTDPEDTDPVLPEDTETEVLTRAQLTAKVAELEQANATLTECLLEMSEAVYA